MIDRLTLGQIADKPHTVFRSKAGELYYEECFTRQGFDGAFTIAYRRGAPTADESIELTTRGWSRPEVLEATPRRRLFVGAELPAGGKPLDAHTVVLSNNDVDISLLKPTSDDDAFFANNDGDDLYYIFQGSTTLETPLGTLAAASGDYVWIPRSLPYRFHNVQDAFWLHFEFKHGLHIPKQYLNEFGQLKMDAPYSHRDFVRPTNIPSGIGPVEVIIKRRGHFFSRRLKQTLLDVVGFDGFVYPVAFNIERFQPKTGLVHLPPTIHATFAAPGALVCSFVPRVTDFHPQAIPCPYPHSSVDCDEMLFYCRGNFTSRRGVGPGAVSLHPAGVPHGPQPGAYEASIGTKRTDELAVMVDTFLPLLPTKAALAIEQAGYHQSWS